jgi:hypothetical protein
MRLGCGANLKNFSTLFSGMKKAGAAIPGDFPARGATVSLHGFTMLPDSN